MATKPQSPKARLLPKNVIRCAGVRAGLNVRFGVKVKIFGPSAGLMVCRWLLAARGGWFGSDDLVRFPW